MNDVHWSRYDGIQFLRFIAAGMVLVTHSLFYASERLGSELVYLWGAGAKGVDIFFVISGFVMVVASEPLAGKSDGWAIFVKSRLIRIVPSYWLATSIKLAALIVLPSVVLHSELDWSSVIKSYFFIPSYNIDGEIKPLLGVGWTLVYEMFFYLIFALALFMRINVFTFVGAVLLIFSGLYFVRPENYGPAWYLMNPIVLEFYMGMIIGFFVKRGYLIKESWAATTFFISLAYILFSDYNAIVPNLIHSGVPAMILVWSVVSLERFFHARIHSSLMFLGAASYVLYLFHPIVAPLAPTVLNKLGFNYYWASVSLSITVAIIFACVLHKWVEAPMTRYMNRLFLSK